MKMFRLIGVVVALLAVGGVNAQLTGDIKTAATYADLLKLSPTTQRPIVWVLGGAAAYDGGGGLFRWSAGSAEATNYAAITATRGTGQYLRIPGVGIGLRAPRVQTLTTNLALVAEAPAVQVAGTGGATTIVAAPTIVDGTGGQELTIEGTSDTDTVTLQDQGTLASSNLQLGSSTRALGAGDILKLKFNATLTTWQEVSFVNN